MAILASFQFFLYLQIVNIISVYALSFPDQGQSPEIFASVQHAYVGMHKSLYPGALISVSISCEPCNASEKVDVKIRWVLRQTSCFAEYLESEIYTKELLKGYYDCPMTSNGFSKVRLFESNTEYVECSPTIQLKFRDIKLFPAEDYKLSKQCEVRELLKKPTSVSPMKQETDAANMETLSEGTETLNSIDSHTTEHSNVHKQSISKNIGLNISASYDTPKNGTELGSHDKTLALLSVNGNTSSAMKLLSNRDVRLNSKHGSLLATVDVKGIFLFVLEIQSTKRELMNITAHITMKNDYGYLSAADYPLLIFYAIMCILYVLYATIWSIVSSLQWRDLLRIQFWIGGVILLGLIEKAVFFAEYESINSTGVSDHGAVLFAEILSCIKRTLARMLVIIVSLGFGIVKPRLGSTLHQVVGVGIVYFILGVIEACLRVLKPKNDPTNQLLFAEIPLAVADSIISWWIFSSLVQTMRTLRLRRNVVKLQLYRHFTNTLIFAVVASVIYMVWSIHSHKLDACISDWKELWVDEAFWHFLFSFILSVIMLLFWPTKNNQRYAYTPLLDSVDDENDDDVDQNTATNAFGMQMRSLKAQPGTPPSQADSCGKEDADLKWVEENIPSSLTEAALPNFLDSDEEIMTVKFERSKME